MWTPTFSCSGLWPDRWAVSRYRSISGRKRRGSPLIGVLDLFDEMPEPRRRAHGTTVLVERGGKAVDTDLHSCFAPFISRLVPTASTLCQVGDAFSASPA